RGVALRVSRTGTQRLHGQLVQEQGRALRERTERVPRDDPHPATVRRVPRRGQHRHRVGVPEQARVPDPPGAPRPGHAADPQRRGPQLLRVEPEPALFAAVGVALVRAEPRQRDDARLNGTMLSGPRSIWQNEPLMSPRTLVLPTSILVVTLRTPPVSRVR